jgi:hypothetical protein
MDQDQREIETRKLNLEERRINIEAKQAARWRA